MNMSPNHQPAQASGAERGSFSLGRVLLQSVRVWPPSELSKVSLFPKDKAPGSESKEQPITIFAATREMFKVALSADPKRLALQGCFAIVDIASQLGAPILGGAFVLAIQTGSVAKTMGVVAGMGLLWGASKVREMMSEVVIPRFNMGLGHTIDRQLFELVASKSMSSISDPDVNADLVRVREQTHRVSEFVRRNFDLVRAGVVFGGACALTATASPTIATALLACGIMRFMAEYRSSVRHQRAEAIVAPYRRVSWGERWNVMNSDGIAEIKNHNQEAMFADRVQAAAMRIDRPFHTERHMRVRDMTPSTVLSWGAMLTGAAIVGYQAATGAIGVNIAVQVMGLIVAMEMSQSNFARQWSEHLKDATFVRAFLGLRTKGAPEVDSSKQYTRIPEGHIPRIEYKDAHFQVKDNGGTKDIVNGVSLRLEPGRMYGMCGPSGQGKTSLIKLLTLEHELSAGMITVDGVPISDVHPRDLHRAVLYLPQNYYVFGGLTTAESVEVGLQNPHEQIDRALSLAEASFMDAGPNVRRARMWKDAPRGRDFSGGERQRLALARALARHRGVIIVDEPTSQLDSKLAEKVIENLRELANKGNTVVLISHDMVNIALCDEIFMVRAGKIAEAGSHTQLLNAGGEYASAWNDAEERRNSVPKATN